MIHRRGTPDFVDMLYMLTEKFCAKGVNEHPRRTTQPRGQTTDKSHFFSTPKTSETLVVQPETKRLLLLLSSLLCLRVCEQYACVFTEGNRTILPQFSRRSELRRALDVCVVKLRRRIWFGLVTVYYYYYYYFCHKYPEFDFFCD